MKKSPVSLNQIMGILKPAQIGVSFLHREGDPALDR